MMSRDDRSSFTLKGPTSLRSWTRRRDSRGGFGIRRVRFTRTRRRRSYDERSLGLYRSRYIARMSLTVRFLGTSASRPTVERNVTSIAVIREGETLLFDCGEGTQRQMMRYGISFALRDIFF